MDLGDWLRELGGVAGRGTLEGLVGRVDLDRAVAAGDVVRIGWGRYALPDLDEHSLVAARIGGPLGLTSAALRHGWPVVTVPDRPHLVLSRGRRLSAADKRAAHVHRGELGPGDVEDGVTTVGTTLAHCLRRLPLAEALAVADSARRSGVPHSVVQRVADSARGPGSAQVRRVARECSPLAANPFESVLRAIALDVAGLDARPQVAIREPGFAVRPDLVDVRLRIVLEADSFEWHGGRAALSADARRYDLLVVHGWLVLRFSYEHVMTQPEFVRDVLERAVALASRMNNQAGTDGAAA